MLEEWKGVFKKHGLRMSLEKTEVMWVGHQNEELNIRLDGRSSKWKALCTLEELLRRMGLQKCEVRCQIQAGTNAWRKRESCWTEK